MFHVVNVNFSRKYDIIPFPSKKKRNGRVLGIENIRGFRITHGSIRSENGGQFGDNSSPWLGDTGTSLAFRRVPWDIFPLEFVRLLAERFFQ